MLSEKAKQFILDSYKNAGTIEDLLKDVGTRVNVMRDISNNVVTFFSKEYKSSIIRTLAKVVSKYGDKCEYELVSDIETLSVSIVKDDIDSWIKDRMQEACNEWECNSVHGFESVKEFEVLNREHINNKVVYKVKIFKPHVNEKWKSIGQRCILSDSVSISMGAMDVKGYSEVSIEVIDADDDIIKYLDNNIDIKSKEENKLIGLTNNEALLHLSGDVVATLKKLEMLGVEIHRLDRHKVILRDTNMFRLKSIIEQVVPGITFQACTYNIKDFNCSKLITQLDLIIVDDQVCYINSSIVNSNELKFLLIKDGEVITNKFEEAQNACIKELHLSDTLRLPKDLEDLSKVLSLCNENIQDLNGCGLTLCQCEAVNECSLSEPDFNRVLNLVKSMRKNIIKVIIE